MRKLEASEDSIFIAISIIIEWVQLRATDVSLSNLDEEKLFWLLTLSCQSNKPPGFARLFC